MALLLIWIILYPTSFLVALGLVAVVVLHRAVARRAVRDATPEQIAMARVVSGGRRRS